MKLFLLRLCVEDIPYDSYEGGIVVSESIEKAKEIDIRQPLKNHTYDKSWNDGEPFVVIELGEANEGYSEGSIILTSFNRG